jgi:aldehyde:ferredoxin oxidoreductase
MGGWFGAELKYAGFDGMVISGQAASPVYLHIADDKVDIRDAKDLWGQGTRATQAALKKRHGNEAQVLAIGPAGENLSRMAVVSHADECASGHSGFGAVFGSKNLKAIVARGTKGVEVADPARLFAEVARTREAAWSSPLDGFLDQPAAGRDTVEAARKRPVCSQSCTLECHIHELAQSDGQDEVIGCIGVVYSYWMEVTEYNSDRLTIPPGKSFGKDEGPRLHRIVDDLGLDLWILTFLQPFFIKCIQEGIDSIRGTKLNPLDPDWFVELFRGMASRTGLGALFADGLSRAIDQLKGELPAKLVAAARSQEFAFGFPAHREGRLWDPEPMPYWVFSMLMYATEARDPTIGTHSSVLFLANIMMADQKTALERYKVLARKLWNDERALDPSFEAVIPVAAWARHQHILIDTLTMCDFAFPRTVGGFRTEAEWRASPDTAERLDAGARLLSAVTGVEFTDAQLEKIAEKTGSIERAMLAEFGRDRSHDASVEPHFELPCKNDGTCLDKKMFDELMDTYYAWLGWDSEKGWPTRKKLEELGLKDVADRLGV